VSTLGVVAVVVEYPWIGTESMAEVGRGRERVAEAGTAAGSGAVGRGNLQRPADIIGSGRFISFVSALASVLSIGVSGSSSFVTCQFGREKSMVLTQA
jgi:hypothetical protein